MTETSKQHPPHFNITTRGSAVDSLKRNPQFRSKEVGNILSNLQVTANDWNDPLSTFESGMVLLGITAAAHSLKTSVMITMDREFWANLNDPELRAKNGAHAKEVFCLDPKAATILYHFESNEASA
jgi:hypothetical protein